VPDIFLTGATGFIGSALLDRLVADGRSVRALVRTSKAADTMRSRGVEPVLGDLEDLEPSSMSGCRSVFHVAGLNALCLRRPLALERTNVAGTRKVVAAAARAGIQRIVYTSSAATIGEPQGSIGTESTSHRGSYLTEYERSKHLAEVAAFEDANAAGLELVAVNPSSVQGPGRTGGTARILISFLRGRLRFAVDTRLSLVFIDDVVDAHIRAEQAGTAGERYLISGWTATVAEAVAVFASVTGIDRRVRYLSPRLLGALAATTAAGYRLLRRDAPLCPEMVAALRHGHAYDGSHAESELGLRYTPPQEWLARTVEWYRAEGLA
jgi:dihydroflavonol-4-reductase